MKRLWRAANPVRWMLTVFLAGARPGSWRDHAVAGFFRHTPVWLWYTSRGVDRWMRYR